MLCLLEMLCSLKVLCLLEVLEVRKVLWLLEVLCLLEILCLLEVLCSVEMLYLLRLLGDASAQRLCDKEIEQRTKQIKTNAIIKDPCPKILTEAVITMNFKTAQIHE